MPLLRGLHRWIGLAIAIPILLVSISGGLLLLRDPYYRVRYPSVAREITAAELARQAELLDAIDTRFGRDGVRLVRFPRPGVNAFHVYLTDGSEALIDPRDASVLDRWRWNTSVPAFLFDLHAHLLMGATGEILNGCVALAIVLLALSGLWLWFPRRASAFRLSQAIPRSAAPAAFLRSHAASGVLFLAPAVVLSATGAGLVFYAPAGAALSALFDTSKPVLPAASVARRADAPQPWSRILSAARAAFPEAGPTMYSPGRGDDAVLTFRTSLPGEWHPNGRSYVLIDPYTAQVVQAIDARTEGRGTRAMHALYPVHAAKVGGRFMIAIAAAAAIGLAWLSGTAGWSWLQRILPAARSSTRRPGTARPRQLASGAAPSASSDTRRFPMAPDDGPQQSRSAGRFSKT